MSSTRRPGRVGGRRLDGRRDAVASGGGWCGDLGGQCCGGVAPGSPSPVADSPCQALGLFYDRDSMLQRLGPSREKREAKSWLLGSMP